ncbi:sugar O-acetyltransferase [Nocardia sp. NBC_00881]|uniref:sugar O-acetyltransferase n=1 Tax=Nocardia sp. NBC_00881 TaxID=2975995 RepID=UPI00386A7BB7|nr:sugar O-acetyltransferase [Nocardia sp. NBC_00881]
MPNLTFGRLYVQTPEFARVAERINHVTALTSRLNLLPFDDTAGRAALLADVFGGPLPETVTLYPPFFTDYGLNTTFGAHVFVNQGCTFMDQGGIRIGAGTMIGPKTHLITSGHPVPPAERREYILAAPIVLEDNVWIGAAATILPGVKIGENSIVGAGAIVTKDIPPNTVVTGAAATEQKRWKV